MSYSFIVVIPQTCRYKSKKYECGLSISCILGGGKPMDLVSNEYIIESKKNLILCCSISSVLEEWSGGKSLKLNLIKYPLTNPILCSCCVDIISNNNQDDELSQAGSINNASK